MFEMWWFCQLEGVRRIWNIALIVEHSACTKQSSVCAASMICSHRISRTKMPENVTDPHGV